MDPDSQHFENQTDVEGSSPPEIIKTECGNNVKIKLKMVMPKREHTEDRSVEEMDKKPNMQKAIV